MQRPHRQPFAKKSLGQNFLSDPKYTNRIIEAVDPSPSDTVVEIGPGRGALTQQLVKSGGNVIAIELDRGLSKLLSERFAGDGNFHLVEADVLEIDFSSLLFGKSKSENRYLKETKLVANLPYYISTAVFQKLVESRHIFTEMVLMFQREVVERIVAEPGDSERGYLTVIVEGAFVIEKLFDVPPSAFVPRPKVWSAVTRLKPKPSNGFDDQIFRTLLSASFAHKRKTIANNLRSEFPKNQRILEDAGIDGQRRAESLTLEEWARLDNAVASFQ